MSADTAPDPGGDGLLEGFLERLGPHNPTRSAHPVEVQELAVSAVRELLRETRMSVSAAATDVSASIGCGVTTVLRWCKLAGVGRDDTVGSREREFEARLAVTQRINRELADLARRHHRGGL
jgi:hypothetical protein